METTLPNFQLLEERIKQLSQWVQKLHEESNENRDDRSEMSDATKRLIEKKIRGLLDLLEEF